MTYKESVQSLQDLCEVQLMEHMLCSDTADGEFSFLDSCTQQPLFSRLCKEVKRLRGVEKKWSRLTEKCPYVDREMYLIEEFTGETDLGYDSDSSEESYSYFERWNFIPEADRGITSAFPNPDPRDPMGGFDGDIVLPLLAPGWIGGDFAP
jgi:hypothetical protein